MIHRTAIGTDIAMLGLWDAQHARRELKELDYEEMEQALQADAKGGRLFYVKTGSDGECDVNLYVDEAIPDDVQHFYKSLNRKFLLRCPSGRLVAGGLEEYAGTARGPVSDSEPVQVDAGDYVLEFHELNEGDINDPAHLAAVVGEEDHAYFLARGQTPRLGCGLLAASTVFLIFKLWPIGLPLLAVAVGLIFYRYWRNQTDSRYQDVKTRIAHYHSRFPLLIFHLSRADGDPGLEGGWHTMEC